MEEETMPLDPQAQSVLEAMAAMNMPPLHTLTAQEARAQMAARPMAVPPEEVARVQDLSVPGPHGPIPLRAYTPAGPGPLPVVVYFHGGGWVLGDIEGYDAVCRALANRSGCLVISVDYRLAPEAIYPAAADDSYAATVWIAEHAAELGGDGSRIAVAGDSAGGNLAAVVAIMARDKGGPKLAYQALIYPVTDFNLDTVSYVENAEGYLLTRDAMLWFWELYAPETERRLEQHASPLRAADLSGLPPALVITAEFDPLRDEGEAYAQRLAEAGVQVAATRYGGMIHGFFTLIGVLDRSAEAINEVGLALRLELGAGAPARA
jgi:acetyl esterase